MPSASGLSGPTTVRSAFFSCANASNPGKSSAPRFTHSTDAELFSSRSCAIPALPGAHHNCVTCGDCASFHTSACSRPPEPMTRSFMKMLPADYAACRVEAMRRRDGAVKIRMTNDEIRKKSENRSPKPTTVCVTFGSSDFGLRASFVIYHSSLVIQSETRLSICGRQALIDLGRSNRYQVAWMS